jgi:hypothetical protein
MNIKNIIFVIVTILWANSLLAQNEKNEIMLGQFIKVVESKHNVKFFYKDAWLEKYSVINSTKEEDLNSILKQAFQNNRQLHYYFYEEHYIILTEIEKLDLTSVDIDYKKDMPTLVSNSEVSQTKIFEIGTPGKQGKFFAVSGIITESISGQKLSGVSIIADEGTIGTTSNGKGEYEIYLPKGYHVLNYRYMGMQPTLRKVRLYSNGSLNVSLEQKLNVLDEISITGEEAKKEKQVIGYKKLKMLDINEIPTFMGEVDIIKHSLLLPGIQSVGEMDMSFSVRGGKGDQNLILVDGMHTYSHSHFFGLFPGINPYSIENATLYKATIPIEYGNRLSSVYDIRIKPGNFNKYMLEGSVSPVSSNLQINGPIIKDKLSFNVSYRGTYSNWILGLIDVKELEKSNVSFYDYNLKLSFKPNIKNNISLFFTNSYDEFSFNKEEIYKTYNTIGSINIKNFFDNDIIAETVIGYTNYKAERIEIPSQEFANINNHSISDIKLNSKLSFNYNDNNKVITGIEMVYHEISPWSIKPENDSSIISPVELNKDKAIEASIFLGDKLKFSRLTLDLGIRLSTYSFLGANNVFKYENNTIIDTVNYNQNELIDFDWGPELRISGNYELRSNQNINFCYNRNRQYISILTNSQAITPISSWQLSNGYIPPQIADQYSLGYNIDMYSKMFSTSVEAYYKNIKNLKDFKNGSKFELNPHPETEIVNAKGKAYGIEFMIKKNRGRLSGWLSYTYSRSFTKSKSSISEKNINDGNYYPSSYDKPHNLSAVINIEPTKRLIISNVINYSSGAPVTLPVSKMQINDNYYMIYSERNEYRLPYYLRWDLSLSIRGSLKRNKKVNGLLIFSIYNVLGRNNVYSIFYENQDNKIYGYKLSIFGNPIPTITYRFNI